MNVPNSQGNVSAKKKLVYGLLNKINARMRKHKKRVAKYKRIDDLSESVIVFCSTATVSAIMISILAINPVALIASASFSSIGMIGGALKKAVNVKEKWSDSKNSYTQLSDLSREITIVMARNHLSSGDIDTLLQDVHHRLSLIEDNEPIILDPHESSAIISIPPTHSPKQQTKELL